MNEFDVPDSMDDFCVTQPPLTFSVPADICLYRPPVAALRRRRDTTLFSRADDAFRFNRSGN